MQVTSPTVTQMTNSLIQNGYIERSPDQSDRRISKLTLTEAGITLAQKATDQYKAIFAGLIDHLGKEQTDQLIHLLSESFTYLQGVGKKNAE
ncbi:transcriptional repressor MprA [compost metagenome]